MNANSIPLTKVTSKKIAAIGHDASRQTLAVQFLRAGVPDVVYHYANFTAREYVAFASAQSLGKHFGAHIQSHKEKHPYVNMGVPSAAPAPAAPAHHQNRDNFATLLSGREMGSEITAEEEAQAKAAGLLVIFGASDDLMEFRGAANDELSVYDGGTALIDSRGVLPDRDNIEDDGVLRDFFAREPLTQKVEAMYCEEGVYVWAYRTDVPHATFEITEGGTPYCRGIVIDVADLTPAACLGRAHAAALDINARCYGEPLPGGQRYSRTTFKDNGDPILLDADGKRSVFCDLNDE
jgi:hypothetical protein